MVVSAGASTTSSTPSTSRVICWAMVTKPWPTSAQAQVTVATPRSSLTRAVEKSSKPSEKAMFLKPTAKPDPRRTVVGVGGAAGAARERHGLAVELG